MSKPFSDLRAKMSPESQQRAEARRDILATMDALLEACMLAVMMLSVEARMHRENQAPKKAEAVEKAIAVIQKAITKATSEGE